jgi:hypothetical protein
MYFQASKIEIKASGRNTASLAMGFAALVVIAIGALPRSIISETERAESVSAQPRLAIQSTVSADEIVVSDTLAGGRMLAPRN